MAVKTAAVNEIIFGQSASFSGGVWENGGRFKAGIEAAFAEVNAAGGVNNRTLRLVSVDDQYDAAKIPANVAKLLAENNLIAFAGFTGSPTVVAAVPYATTAKMPMIGPLTGTASIRKTFNPYVINVRAGYDDEAMAMLKLLVEVKRLKRISICYQNDAFGLPSANSFVAGLAKIAMSPSGMHPFKLSALTTFNYTSYADTVAANKPQALVFFSTATFVTSFLTAISEINGTKDIFYVLSSFTPATYITYLREKGLDPTHFYQTQIVPHPLSRASNMSIRYRAAMQSFEGATNAVFDYVSLEGYVLGRFLIDALWRTKTLTKEGLLDAIYSTRMFTLDELLAGPFSNTCDSSATSLSGRSSLCNCNQGLRFVSTTGLTASYEFTVAASDLVYPITECFSPNNVVTRPVLLATFVPSNSSAAIAGMSSVTQAIAAGSANTMFFESMLFAESGPLNATTQRLYEVGNRSLLMGALGGMVLPEQAVYPVIEVFTQPALPAKSFSRNTIHVLATLQQEIFVDALHVAKHFLGVSHALLFSDRYVLDYGVDVVDIASKSLAAAGTNLDVAMSFRGNVMPSSVAEKRASSASTPSFVVAISSLPLNCGVVMVLGMTTASEAASLVSFLRTHASAVAYLPFQDLSIFWDVFQCLGSCEDFHSRLIFSTNLPNWNLSSTSAFVARYISDLGNLSFNLANPLTVVGYLLGRVIDDQLLSYDEIEDESGAFLKVLYRTGVITIDDISLGTFVDTQCSDQDCLCNQGANKLNVFRVKSIMEGESPEMQVRFDTCSIDYKLKSKSYTLAIIVIVATLGGMLVVGVVAFFAWRNLHLRYRVLNAPKDHKKKFCSLFLSLKRESLLWELYPSGMPLLQAEVDQIVTHAVSKSRCYHVKNIGAAVLIVSGESSRILACAAELSLALAEVKWHDLLSVAQTNHNASDQTHRDTVMSYTVSSDDCATSGPTSTLGWKVDTSVGFGIGIYRDTGRITHDVSKNAYDYSGPSVDGAAAVSDTAVADQILVSENVGTGGNPQTSFVEFATARIRKHEVHLMQYNPPNQTERFFEAPKDDAANVDSIAAQLEQQAWGVTIKKVTVLCVRLAAFDYESQERTRDDFAKCYAACLKRIHDLVQREKGYIHSLVGGQLVVTFNAVRPTPHALRHAIVVAAELTSREIPLISDGEVVCGIASGMAVIGLFKVGLRSYDAIVSNVTQTAMHLQDSCTKYSGTAVLTIHTAFKEASECARTRFVDIVRLPNAAKVAGLVAVDSLRVNLGDDATSDDDPMPRITNVFLKILNGASPYGEQVDQALKSAQNSVSAEAKPASLLKVEELVDYCTANRCGVDEWTSRNNNVAPLTPEEGQAAQLLTPPITSPKTPEICINVNGCEVSGPAPEDETS